jgi:hypothetical protein
MNTNGKDLTGQRFGMLTALEPTDQRKSNHIVWRCRCDCGGEKLVSSQHLKNGNVTSCGCAVSAANKQKIIDLTGQRFGRLTALEPTNQRLGNSTIWRCRCDCGNICYVASTNLRKGNTKSCGCFSSERHRDIIQTARGIREQDYVENTDVRRLANKSIQSNNTSGVTGVSYDKSIQSWRAAIMFQGRIYRLGARRDKEAAIQLRKEAEEKIHDGFLAWYAQEYPRQWAALQKSNQKGSVIMTTEQRAFCLSEIANYSDHDAYISDLALSSVWDDKEDADIPPERIEELGKLWDAYHRPFPDILSASGMTKAALSRRFFIPYKTVQNWCATGREYRECPVYVRLMMQEILGIDK